MEPKTEPKSELESSVPGLNEDLVRKYAAGASADNIRNLITLFDTLKRERDRAESLSRAYLKQLTEQTKLLAAMREGNSEPRPETNRSRPAPSALKPNLKSEPKPRTSAAIAVKI